MKKQNLLYLALALSVMLALSSCHDHGVHIRVNDDADEYRLRASFDEDLTDDVQRVINRHLHKHNAGSTAYIHTDCDFELGDGTNFYLKLKPGQVRIRFDRDDNTEESYEDMHAMCDEIKDVLARRDEYRY